MHSRLGFILLAVVLALGASSCAKKQVTVDTPEGKMTITKGRGGAVEVEGPGGKTTVSEGGTKIVSDEGVTTVDKDSGQMTFKGADGTTTSTFGAVPQEAVDKMGLPVYPGAKGTSHASIPDGTVLMFNTSDDFAKVVEWYKKSLAGWDQPMTLDMADVKSATFDSKDKKKQVSITWMKEAGETTINLMSKP